MNTKYNNILTQLINVRREMTFAVLDVRHKDRSAALKLMIEWINNNL